MTHEALRLHTAFCDDHHIVPLRISGERCRAAIERITPIHLFLSDGQIRPTLLLDESANIRAELHVARQDDEYLLLAEGVDGPALAECLPDTTIEPLYETHALMSVHGPYAWELVAEVVGADVMSMPYLSVLRDGEVVAFRIGKTGEYGYHLLVKRERADALRDRIREAGARYSLATIDLATLDDAAIESGFFVMRREGRSDLDLIELQQQWRVSYDKQHFAATALARKRATGPRRRTTTVLSACEIAPGDPVTLDGEPIGRVLSAMRSPWLDRWVALTVLERRYAHAGVRQYRARDGALETVSPPLLSNRSLFVKAQRHSYQTRADDDFPVIA